MSDDLAANLRLFCSNYRSISEVCRLLGFNRQQFARYLSGAARPSQHNLHRIATGLGLRVDDLLLPRRTFEQRFSPGRGGPRDRFTHMLDTAFPGDLQRLRPLLGYYHMHFLLPDRPGVVNRSLIVLYEYEGKVYSKTIERSGTNPADRQLSKYEGMVSFLGNYIFLLEFETLFGDTLVETMMFPAYRRRLDILTGLTFGVTSNVHRQPFASPIVWKYLGVTVDRRAQIRACAIYDIEDRRIDPAARRHLQSGGPLQTLSSRPN